MDRLIVGIHPDQIGKESYSKKWDEFLKKMGVEVKILNLLATNALEQAKGCDGIMWRWQHRPAHKQSAKMILYTIENILHIPVFPENASAWHFDEKVAQYYLMQAINIPTVNTWVFWHREQALQWAQETSYPIIFKLSSGAGSSNVLKLNNAEEAVYYIKQMFERGVFPYQYHEYKKSFLKKLGNLAQLYSNVKQSITFLLKDQYPKLNPIWWKPEYGYAYFQEFLPDNDFDTRITIIGDRAFGFRRLNRPNDFRASGSGKIDFDPEKINLECIRIAFDASRKGNFSCMAYDFLFKDGRPLICEMSYAFADWAVEACPGHWKSDLTWVPGNMWPEEAQIEDFIKRIKLNAKISRT